MDLNASIRAIVREEIERSIGPHLGALRQLQGLMGLKVQGRRGRPPGSVSLGGARRGRQGEIRPCAVVGCPNNAKSKGYCAAHYQKYRMLKARGQAEGFGWSDNAAPHSVTNPTLPRGRAAAKTATGEGAVGKVGRPRRAKK